MTRQEMLKRAREIAVKVSIRAPRHADVAYAEALAQLESPDYGTGVPVSVRSVIDSLDEAEADAEYERRHDGEVA